MGNLIYRPRQNYLVWTGLHGKDSKAVHTKTWQSSKSKP